jgi:drug/metabolite transporter, DME family
MIGELAALGAAISWAIAPILYRNALTNANPISANIMRCITSGIVLTAFLVAFGLTNILLSLPVWVLIVTIISGVIGLGVADTMYMWGLKVLGVSRAVPLASTYPLFGLVWAVWLLGQPLSYEALAGAAIILLGIWLLSRKNHTESTSPKGKIVLLGIVASITTAVIWSVSLTLMNVVVSSSSSDLGTNYAIVTLRIASLALLFTAFSPFIDKKHDFIRISKKTIIVLCLGGLIANGLGWILMNYSFLLIPETIAIPISSTSPLFAALAGFIFFREKITLWTILGAISVVIGIVLIFVV